MAVVGAYERWVELVTVSGGEVRGELEDDFHHFRVSIAHDGRHVTALDGEALRHPWSTCPEALGPLSALVGAPLDPDATAAGGQADPRQSCTHWFDLSGLAIAHAASGRARRRYDVVVPDRTPDGRTTAHLDRDGRRVLDWDVDPRTVLGPEPYAGRRLGRGFLAWARSALDPEVAEAAVVLRRACTISMGRLMDLDDYQRASDVGHGLDGTCHTFTPGVMEVALRMRGSSRR